MPGGEGGGGQCGECECQEGEGRAVWGTCDCGERDKKGNVGSVSAGGEKEGKGSVWGGGVQGVLEHMHEGTQGRQ